MPPRRRLARDGGRPSTRPVTRSANRRADTVPDVYQEMLAEVSLAGVDSIAFPPSPRPVKRRKLSGENIINVTSPVASSSRHSPAPGLGGLNALQVVYDDFQDSDESDVEFEDVDLNAGEQSSEPSLESRSLELDLTSPTTSKQQVQRRKPISKAERELRIDVHKWHVLSLLAHLATRNVWCDNEVVHSVLKSIVSRKTISLLHVDESKSQYQRSHSFNDGIEDLCIKWRTTWKVTAQGMRRAYWKDDVDAQKASDDAEDPVDLDDFIDAAKSLSGSRDLGAQMFCALLRSVAVETRLVNSMQALPLIGAAKDETPVKKKPNYVQAGRQNYGSQRPTEKKRRILDSPYPIFWVEVFSPAISQWIPLDPLVRNTINKPRTGFEPPASDLLNSMSYVVAFEDDRTAKDVTRRYTQWFNAKTRKTRVEHTKGGEKWWKQTIRFYRKQTYEPRDEIEDAALLQKTATEGMPKNVQDFKGHPVYVLERHLKVNEVIHPKRECGKVAVGIGQKAKLESVFRRQDVHLCRSADAWYRQGMDIKHGEQPLKRVAAKSKQKIPEDSGDEEDTNVALYAEYQTQVYEPPSVVDHRIPRNAYGNLDVYVPSMIPAGAVHIRHPLAARAAESLFINYADAVTGFHFKGRQGTAVIDGVVVDSQFTAAMIATTEALEEQASEEVESQRSQIVLSMWKKMLTALRVRQRIEDEYGGRDEPEDPSDDDSNYAEGSDAGGFVPDADDVEKVSHERETISLTNLKARLPPTLPEQIVHRPVVVVRSPHRLVIEEDDLFGSEPSVHNQTDEMSVAGMSRETHEGDMGGGFIPEDGSDDAGGGFVPEEPTGREEVHRSAPGEVEDDLEGGFGSSPKDPKIPDVMQMRSSIQIRAETIPEHPTTRSDSSESRESTGKSPNEQDSLSDTSLLSHDPDEDNAEPDWLLDAIDE